MRPPVNVTARAVSGPQVELTWDQWTVADGFRVLRARTAGGPYTQVATTSAVQEEFTDTTVSPVTTYYYVVQATYQGKVSRNSAARPVPDLRAHPGHPRGPRGNDADRHR